MDIPIKQSPVRAKDLSCLQHFDWLGPFNGGFTPACDLVSLSGLVLDTQRFYLFSHQIEGALWRPTECFLISRKYCDGRQNTRGYGMEYYNGRQGMRCYKMGYYNGRQSTINLCGNTLTADRVLPQFAQILWRPTKYAMPRDGILSRPTEYPML